MIYKFNSATSPQPSVFEQFEFIIGVFKWKVTIDGSETVMNDGDYVYADDNGVPTQYYTAAQYANDNNVKVVVRERIGKDTERAIFAALNGSGTSSANKYSITTTIGGVFDALDNGEIQAARDGANSITPAAPFTAGVKTQLLAVLDAAIAKL